MLYLGANLDQAEWAFRQVRDRFGEGGWPFRARRSDLSITHYITGVGLEFSSIQSRTWDGWVGDDVFVDTNNFHLFPVRDQQRVLTAIRRSRLGGDHA